MTITGQRTLFQTLCEIAEHRPETTAIHHIVLDGAKEKSVLLSYRGLVNRINEMKSWFQDQIITGKIESFSNTIAYLAPNDLRTLLLPIAAAECNLVVLLLSPRNSLEAQSHLIQTSQCSALIVDKVFDHVADQLQSVRRIAAPDLWHILAKPDSLIGGLSAPSTWDHVSHAGLVKLHTSGSTGLPKSVLITHASLSTVDIQRNVKDSQDQRCQLAIFGQAERPYTAFPFFHVAGFELACFMLFSGSTIVLGPPHQPTSLDIVRTVLREARSDALLLPPSILDDIVLDSTLLEEVCQVKLLYYGGGQVSQHTGDVLSRRTRLFTGMGGTEVGSICLMPLAPDVWSYFNFAPENGITWQPVGTTSDEYEMVVTKNSQYLAYQAVFHSFPDLTEWRTKDIFAKHPTVEGLWEYRGRLDDLIVLSTGEKLNPSVIEAVVVANCSFIKAAVVVGSKRARPALLIELADKVYVSGFDEARFRHEITNSLASRNTDSVSRDGQVESEDIVFAVVDRPFSRTAKGTINRMLTQNLYQTEIDALYIRSRKKTAIHKWNLDCSDVEALQLSLLREFRSLLRIEKLEVHDNLFYLGLDSRQTQAVALSIRQALSTSLTDENLNDSFKAESIYTNPTILSLSQKILASGGSATAKALGQQHAYDRILDDNLKDCSDRITQNAAKPKTLKLESNLGRQHVLLTGSTGYVGSWLLHELCGRPEIVRITCLDRSNPKRPLDVESSHEFSANDRPIVVREVAVLDQPKLGLSDTVYQQLLSSVTSVVHCQWPVDFNQSLAYFEPNIRGTVNLIQFCLENTSNHCPLFFLSSIATVQQYPAKSVPEIHLSSLEYCQTAYGESKLVASELLNLAAYEGNLNAIVCRLGQVCGPIHSIEKVEDLPRWPSRDWFPTLLRCSKFMNCLPENIGKAGRIDWIPVDVLSGIIADDIVNQALIATTSATKAGTHREAVYRQLVNPAACNYADFLPVLQQRLGSSEQDPCAIVSFSTWVNKLEKYSLQALAETDGVQPPGAELLQFFRELSKTSDTNPVVLETRSTMAALPRMRSLTAITSSNISEWLETWNIDSKGIENSTIPFWSRLVETLVAYLPPVARLTLEKYCSWGGLT